MSIDLTPLVLRANEYSARWSKALVHSTLRSVLEANPASNVDWEEGDEEWARVLMNQEVGALVCARIPLVLATGSIVQPNALPEFVLWHRVGDLSFSIYRVDKATLENVFERELSDNVDYEDLSADEFWWATV